MDTPKRIQRKRTKGFNLKRLSHELNRREVVYVGRGSKWGNSFTVDKYGREGAVDKFREYIFHPNSPHDFEPQDIELLRGKNLACWCKEGESCHADVLLELANSEVSE